MSIEGLDMLKYCFRFTRINNEVSLNGEYHDQASKSYIVLKQKLVSTNDLPIKFRRKCKRMQKSGRDVCPT